MSVVLALFFMLFLLLTALVANLPLYWALLLGLIPFTLIALKQGSRISDIMTALWRGFLTPKKVYLIMLVIGLAKPLFIASGATGYLIQVGSNLISPHSFLLIVFLFTFVMTLLLGSAIGTTGLVGVTFMNMATLGGVNLSMTAGAILSAIYLGERASPISSCANLVAEICGIPLFKYIKTNLLSRWKSLIVILIAYSILSYFNPLIPNNHLNHTSPSLSPTGTIYSLLPFMVLILYILIKKEIITALILSALTSFIVAYFYMNISFETLLSAMLGEQGLLGMFKASLVLMSAALLTGLFEGTTLMAGIQETLLTTLKNNRFKLIFVSSFIGSVIGCSQTFAVLFAKQMVRPLYEENEQDCTALSCDLANTAVLMPSWIPWNVAFSIPVTLLSADYTMLFWAFSVTFIPISSFVYHSLSSPRIEKNSILN